MALGLRRNPNSYFGRLTTLKKLFWLYFLLLMFEGALRKWVVPQLSAPLLVIRDPVSLYIVWEAYRTHKWPQKWTIAIAVLTVLYVGLFMVQIVAGDSPLLVGLYGLRSYLLPFPVIFIMGENLDENDLRNIGKFTLWLLLPMTILEVAQYLSPTGSFVNNGAYEGGAQIGYVGEHVRAAGTFSFVVGTVQFDVLAAAFIFYGLVKEGLVKKWLLWADACALVLSVPMTGSRTLVSELGILLACVALGAVLGVSQFGRVLRVILPLTLVYILVSQLSLFSDAMSNLTDRITGSESEGATVEATVFYRAFQPTIVAIEESSGMNNWMGIGMGRGAIAVSKFIQDTLDASAGEDEISREFMEMGLIAGGASELFKVFLAITIFGAALARAREHDPLALLLISLALTTLAYSILEQPTEQGFMVIGVAFCIAAARAPALTSRRAMPSALQRQQLPFRRRIPNRAIGGGNRNGGYGPAR